MGSMHSQSYAEGVENGIPLTVALTAHLRSNHYPPLPIELVPAAEEAIANASNDDWDDPIDLRGAATYKDDRTSAPTWACVEAWHLDAFLESDDG